MNDKIRIVKDVILSMTNEDAKEFITKEIASDDTLEDIYSSIRTAIIDTSVIANERKEKDNAFTIGIRTSNNLEIIKEDVSSMLKYINKYYKKDCICS